MLKAVDNKIKWYNYNNTIISKFDDCHIFKFELNVYEEIENKYQTILSQNEIAKADLFKQRDDKKKYVIGKYFTRILLANKLGIKAPDIVFFETGNKKPATNYIHFNISHSGNLVLVAISKSPIGIDVEFVNPKFDFQNLLNECFISSELLQVNSSSDFYRFWTKKEAIIKATGEGLIDDLHDIDCSQNIVLRHNNKYQIATGYADENHICSLAYTNEIKNLHYWSYNKL